MRRFLTILFLLAAFSKTASADTFANEWRFWETPCQFAGCAAAVALYPICGSDEHFLTVLGGTAASAFYSIASCWVLKLTIPEKRPSGTLYSFPSGHTSIAFCGAELVREYYGWGWGAGAYALAAGVATMRVVRQCHWWWDCVAGAAIGVASARAGMATSRWIVAPIVEPSSGTLCLHASYRF